MNNLSESLLKITKGTGIVFASSLIGLGLTFLARILIYRIGTDEEYGIFSLAFVINLVVSNKICSDI